MLEYKDIEGYSVYCLQEDSTKPVRFHVRGKNRGTDARVIMLKDGSTIVESHGSVPERILSKICKYMELGYNEFLQFWRNKFYLMRFVG